MRLWAAETRKVWKNKKFLSLLLLLLCANLFLHWIQTNPKPMEPPPRAYRLMARDLNGLSLEAQRIFIDEKYETISGVRIVNAIVVAHANGNTFYAQQMQKEYAAVWADYKTLYDSGEYLRYTDNLAQEYVFLAEIRDEFNQVYGYKDFLNGLQQKAAQYSEISIFSDGGSDGYDILNIHKTADDYKHMHDVNILYTPSKGVSVALAFEYTDAVYIVGILLLAASLVSEEKNRGLLAYTRSMPAGRIGTAMAKCAAMFVSMLLLTVLFFGSNLIFAHLYYGIGPLFRSIQSIPGQMYSTLRVQLSVYIGLFGLFKWAAGCILGMATMFFCFIARTTAGGYLLSGLFILSQWGIRAAVPATGKYNVIKYASTASLLQSNEQLGGYQNLYWFGKPISLGLVSACSAVAWLCLFGCLFLWLFAKNSVVAKTPRGMPVINWYKHRKYTSLLGQEAFKLFFANKAAMILLFLTVFQVYQACTAVSYIDAEELYYRQYMRHLSGPYTEEKYRWLEEERHRLQRWDNLEYGELPGNAPTWGIQPEIDAFERTLSQVSYTNSQPGAEIVYETGYLLLFDIYDTRDTQQVLLTAICIALCFCGFFSMEETSGMQEILSILPAGREDTLRAKLRICSLIILFTTLLSFLPQWVQVLRDYGLNNIFAQARSLYIFQNTPIYFSILSLIIFSFFTRFICSLLMAYLCLAASYFFKSSILAALSTAAVFCLPIILYQFGVRYIRWLGPYPLFHSSAVMTQRFGLPLLLAYCALCGIIIGCVRKYFFKRYMELHKT